MKPSQLKLSSPLSSQYLARFLSGEPTARDFPGVADKEVRRLASTLCRELPPDLLDDVVNEMWVQLLSHPPEFREGGSVRAYLRLALQNALKSVRASYSEPGKPKRQRRFVEIALTACPREVSEVPLEELADPVPSVENLASARCVAMVLEKQPDYVARAFRRVYLDGESVAQVALDEGLVRTTLSRAMECVVKQCSTEFSAVA